MEGKSTLLIVVLKCEDLRTFVLQVGSRFTDFIILGTIYFFMGKITTKDSVIDNETFLSSHNHSEPILYFVNL